ncbi:MAG: AMP-binding protein [Ectothiorhodospiraceae bacterium]|nr:AMP-binding protein [Ectothiorhodospiraceae bacterium]MCH8503311.1 AMP-binding protein [Ectothiorhodospiraceae bacterium]
MTTRIPMRSYEQASADFRWSIPEHFNFGADVVDAYAEDPHKLAMIWRNAQGEERRLTFRDISESSNRLANALNALGITRGDRVLVVLPRIPEWQISMVACLKAGIIPIPCVEMLTERDLQYRVEHAGAKAVITTAANTLKFGFAGGKLLRFSVGEVSGWHNWETVVSAASPDYDPVRTGAEEPAIMYYTSGSSGHPKGVTHAARALYAWRVSAWHWLDLGEDDLMWCTADTGWSKAGTSILFGPWSCGTPVLFYDGPFEPQRRLAMLRDEGVTVFCAAATELRRLLDEDADPAGFPRLRLTVSAGESVNPAVVKQWSARMQTPLLDGYGQTETLMTVLNFQAMPVKPGSMGRPLPGTEALVLDDHEARPVEVGRAGRLAIRLPNPQVMLGYWNDPERSRQSITRVDGEEYFVTGDRVLMDEDGYLFYQGRDDDLINSAGYRIGPLEVENALMEHPAVQECAAVASPDPERGEVVKAFVVLRQGYYGDATLVRTLQDHAKTLTAPYKYPRKMEFVDELPKTPTGKLRRKVLRAREYGENVD